MRERNRLHFRMKQLAAAVLLAFLAAFPAQAMAGSPYQGYVYDSLQETPLSINGYLYEDSIDGYDLPTGPLKSPEDIFAAEDDTLYIVDGGNNRVIHLDAEKNVLGVIGDSEGKGQLNSPKGLFVTSEGRVFVADTENRRIAVFNASGEFEKEYPAPQSPLLGKDFIYSPSKIIVDKRGYMFVVSDGAHQGLMQIRPDGTFAGFFGANHVGFSLSRLIIKLIATQEQREQLANVRPPEFSNLYQDKEGFIYTTTLGIRFNQVKRLSAVGVDTLNLEGQENRYGDLYMPRKNWEPLYESFVDLTVDKNGLITALDQTTGKAFQYDKLGNLLFIFGGLGEQDGLFKTPASIDHTSDGTIYIVDRTRNRVDRFRTTPFADKVHEASALYVDGRYDEASKPWHEVLEMNGNYDLANRAIGKALYKAERYKEAMGYFEVARDREGYSQAFLEYRKQFMREYFTEIAAAVVFFLIALRFGLRLYRKKWRKPAKQGGIQWAKGGGAR